jgi:hypothetical protein
MKWPVLILGIAAPLSWFLGWLVVVLSRDLSGFGNAIALVLLVHIICLFGLLWILALLIKRRQRVGEGLAMALGYFALILIFFFVTMGPRAFFHDVLNM